MHVFKDEESGEYPFAVAFFLFRSGLHDFALDYLLRSNNEDVKQFAELYKMYVFEYNYSIHLEDIDEFFQNASSIGPSYIDLYKDAMIHLMIGS